MRKINFSNKHKSHTSYYVTLTAADVMTCLSGSVIRYNLHHPSEHHVEADEDDFAKKARGPKNIRKSREIHISK